MKGKFLKRLTIFAVWTVLLGISFYTAFATKSDTAANKERLQQLQTEYSNKQLEIEAEIGSMPRNTEEDWKKIREAENNLKNMPMQPEANQLMHELSTPISEQPKENLETRIFYSRDALETQNYIALAADEKDPAILASYQKSAKIMEHKKSLLDQVEKDFKEGKGTYEEWNKRIDELMAIDPCR
ncbi:hypothetical protein Sgly_1735 [Syntrophobotulus glycolicus DSM 8271]|uniref:Uncharacterized protein n=1 Tax=Syntrophobotulus glycolicus (strain DSM 8271 / FlGlyR) TaxID=645991 RepID=F0SYZ5_SYNGF|nr:hypothetical protein [Syntrophobotulus glycolicus]ADY56032.1 hypothetical protein Sgly_1735 [Syntrophobotulus glycolicus DSM 8271]